MGVQVNPSVAGISALTDGEEGYVKNLYTNEKRWCVLGDSIAAQQTSNTSTTEYLLAKGPIVRALMRLGFPATFKRAYNFATDGSTTADMLTAGGQLDTLLAAHAVTPFERCFISLGTNDTNGGVTIATILANLTTIFTRLKQAGIISVVWGVLPRGADVAMTNPKRNNLYITQWERELAVENPWVEFIDCGRGLEDNSTAFGNGVASMFYDSPPLHPSDLGAEIMGEAIYSYYSARGMQPQIRGVSSAADLYNATYNPMGVVFESPNPVMTGTTGSLTGGATGQAPTGMTCNAGAWAKGTQTLTSGQTLPTAVCTLAASSTHYLYDDATASGAWVSEGPLPGDVIYGEAIVELAATVNVTQVILQLNESDGTTTIVYQCANQQSGSPVVQDVPGTKTIYMRTPDCTVRTWSGAGSASIFLRANCITTAGASGTFTVKSFAVRKRYAG